MLALRSIARSVPRSFSRLSSQAARPSFSAFRTTARLQASWTPISRAAVAPFSTSMLRLEGNEELVAKLDAEISVEDDVDDPNSVRDSIAHPEFIENGPWELHDPPNSQEVKLTRTYNDEKIEISFSIADISGMESQAGMTDPDAAYDDAEFDEPEASAQSGGANTKGSVNQGRTAGGNVKVAPEDRVAPADRPELDDEEGEFAEEQPQSASFPVRMLIKVTKSSQRGAMEIEAVATEGETVIESVNFYPEANLADPENAENEFKRRVTYAGPRYDNLDVELQELWDRYLQDRGIDTELSLWLPDFVDYKEQKEYVRWLQNVKDFVS